jgi:hypothetical protein
MTHDPLPITHYQVKAHRQVHEAKETIIRSPPARGGVARSAGVVGARARRQRQAWRAGNAQLAEPSRVGLLNRNQAKNGRTFRRLIQELPHMWIMCSLTFAPERTF